MRLHKAAIFLLFSVCGVAKAAVFQNNRRWETDEKSGFTIIPVCIRDDSSADGGLGDGCGGALIRDEEPSLNAVVGRMRWALSRTWERNSSVRFVGFKKCSELSPTDLRNTVQVFIDKIKGNYNEGLFIKLMPWGYDCYGVDMDGRIVCAFSFQCAEEYAIHEFGHAIGFLHEWQHPATPQDCADLHTVGEPRLSSAECSETFGEKAYTISDVNFFDRDSIMTYDSTQCSDKTGTRFGSPIPDATDISVLKKVYPPRNNPWKINAVGVIPNTIEDCPPGRLVGFHLTNQRGGSNINEMNGWTGAFKTDRGSRSTDLLFCQVDGNLFGSLAKPKTGNSNYAVLLLGSACPNGAIPFRRYHDDTGRYTPPGAGYSSENYMFGDWGFNDSNNNNGHTSLLFCLFKQTDVSTFKGLPNLGFEYGVLANEQFSMGEKFGFIFIDDVDSDNNNKLDSFRSPIATDCQGVNPDLEHFQCINGNLNDDDKNLIISTAVEDGRNTKYYLAKVKKAEPTSLPSKTPSRKPSVVPSSKPSTRPSPKPSKRPSNSPSLKRKVIGRDNEGSENSKSKASKNSKSKAKNSKSKAKKEVKTKKLFN